MIKINKKKVAGICPVGMKKTVCPSIRATQETRTALLSLQREKNPRVDKIQELRSVLKERKKQGIAGDCESCSFNTPAGARSSGPQ
ncbi:MAG: hypothetical protein E3K32_08075 [wastewater metagenome]|nr:hypothetical protein [Candidatus Loosdrechtia aerotolerans]